MNAAQIIIAIIATIFICVRCQEVMDTEEGLWGAPEQGMTPDDIAK